MSSFPAREDPFVRLVRFVRERRVEYAQELAIGRWDGEAQARELVGRIKQLDEIESEMKTISGPNSHFGERDV